MDRITAEEAKRLFERNDILQLGRLANEKKKHLHPGNYVTFVVDRNINYTNICTCKCKFCGFYKDKQENGAYLIDQDELAKKIEETTALDGTQILLQGGLHPGLDIQYYEELLGFIKKNFDIWIHGFSPPEIDHIAKLSSLTIEETFTRLKAAGLDSMPGGGAELLVDTERSRISPNKINSKQWLDIMRKAHSAGLRTSATMMFKKSDSVDNILEHLSKIRELQDETGGFTAFIPWPLQPDNTELDEEHSTAVDYLKVLALSRIFLDNVSNIQVSWVTQGEKIGQTGLFFGGNDFGSLMIEENVVAACGATYSMSIDSILHNIREAGFVPAQRDMEYNIIKVFD
ncbi:cyclic dehypoxanthinyl futalosine synthase [Flexistipes sp.]|uniref:cyclic dehypoxanthinyl futalosine synthase n=1 Tax=Flexistipes sp. TaxID=3088135 RepID=UPI002E1AABC2|nr:cyclic dehypoxanthinyl futalosine synthase [Flexistipes sp.]